MKPATSIRCTLCNYCFSNQADEKVCMFWFDFHIKGKPIPNIDCPFSEKDS